MVLDCTSKAAAADSCGELNSAIDVRQYLLQAYGRTLIAYHPSWLCQKSVFYSLSQPAGRLMVSCMYAYVILSPSALTYWDIEIFYDSFTMVNELNITIKFCERKCEVVSIIPCCFSGKMMRSGRRDTPPPMHSAPSCRVWYIHKLGCWTTFLVWLPPVNHCTYLWGLARSEYTPGWHILRPTHILYGESLPKAPCIN